MGRDLFVVLAMGLVGIAARGDAEETNTNSVVTPSTGSEVKTDPNRPVPTESERDTPIRVRVPVRVPVTEPQGALPNEANESRPSSRSSAGFRTEFRELPFPRPSAEEEAKLRQELKETLQRKVDSLSVEGLMEEVYREREASREAEGWNKLQRLREELHSLQKEFPGTAAAQGAAKMQEAVSAVKEPASAEPSSKREGAAPDKADLGVSPLPRGKVNQGEPATHPLALKVASGTRRVTVSPRAIGEDVVIRGNIGPNVDHFERVVTMSRGVRIVIDEPPSSADGSTGVQITAERAVLWTNAQVADEVRGIEIDDHTRFQLYLEGDVVISQEGRVLKASSAYYDFHERHGRFTKGEIGIRPVEFDAAVRIRGAALREKAQNKHARTSAVERAFETGEGSKVLDEKGPAVKEELDGTPSGALEANPGAPFLDPIQLEGEKVDRETKRGAPL